MKPSELVYFFDPAALRLLKTACPDRVITQGDPHFDQVRAGHSQTDQHDPDLIVMADSTADVVAAVDFARSQDIPLAVKATGHGFAHPYRGGLMVDTSRLRTFSLDPVGRTARVAAGVQWWAILRTAQAHGLIPLLGGNSTTGVMGYSLWGGFGWLLRSLGAAVDSVTGAQVITADGYQRRVSEHQEPELFWGLRGSGNNLGIATELSFKLYPLEQVYGGTLYFPLAKAAAVLEAYREWAPSLPDSWTTAVVLLRPGQFPHWPTLHEEAVIGVRGVCTGSSAAEIARVAPLRLIGGLLADSFEPMGCLRLPEVSQVATSAPRLRRWTGMLGEFTAATVDALVQVAGEDASDPVTALEIYQLGGAMSRVPAGRTAFCQRDAPYIVQAIQHYEQPSDAATAAANTAQVAAALAPFLTGGVLPSWLGEGDHGVERTQAGFTAEHYQRLQTLKQQVDPSNLFRHNHNIPPPGWVGV